MAQCDMGFEHEAAVEAEPEVIPVPVDAGPNEHAVEIAEIEAAASIEREKLWTEQEGLRLESEVQELRGELRGMREVLDRIAPPEPEVSEAPAEIPVVIPDAPAPVEEEVPAPPPTDKAPKSSGKGGGYWSNYR